MLAVVGPSGSGKSSLVRAGVAAARERVGRGIVVITPGARPMDAFTAVPVSGPPPVLVVDQCEEVFSLCEDPAERERLFVAMAAHAERAELVVVLRADRMGEVPAHPELARLVERGLYLLGAMSEDDLRAAIAGPARQAGLPLEAGLVGLLLREVQGEPGALPLLSHALRETWLRREGRTLTVAGYQASGASGVRWPSRPNGCTSTWVRTRNRCCVTCSSAWSHPSVRASRCAAGCRAGWWPATSS